MRRARRVDHEDSQILEQRQAVNGVVFIRADRVRYGLNQDLDDSRETYGESLNSCIYLR